MTNPTLAGMAWAHQATPDQWANPATLLLWEANKPLPPPPGQANAWVAPTHWPTQLDLPLWRRLNLAVVVPGHLPFTQLPHKPDLAQALDLLRRLHTLHLAPHVVVEAQTLADPLHLVELVAPYASGLLHLQGGPQAQALDALWAQRHTP